MIHSIVKVVLGRDVRSRSSSGNAICTQRVIGVAVVVRVAAATYIMVVGLIRREEGSRFHKPRTFSRMALALCLVWTVLQQRSLHLRATQDNYDRIIDPTDWEIQSKAANATTAVVTSSATNDNNDKPFRKWAYAFVVGGALHPRAEYRGFLYSVVVAAKQLRDAGSVADVVVLVQLSYATGETKLPPEQEQLLQSQKVKIHYIPKFAAPVHEKFYALMMEKFRILSLTEYSRVIFLDSDVMPVCSLDHIFDLSEPKDGQTPQLKENVILAQKVEPSHVRDHVLRKGENDSCTSAPDLTSLFLFITASFTGRILYANTQQGKL